LGNPGTRYQLYRRHTQLASKRQGDFPPVFPANRVEEEAPEETQREEGAKVAKEAVKAVGAAKAVEAVEAVETAEQEEERVSLPLNPTLRRVRSRSRLLRRDQPSKISLQTPWRLKTFHPPSFVYTVK